MMLSLINKYGMSHVCGSLEFVDIGKAFFDDDFAITFNFPYLDILLKNTDCSWAWPRNNYLEFYLRGTRTQELKFKNLYEYLLALSFNRSGLLQSDKNIFFISETFQRKFQLLY